MLAGTGRYFWPLATQAPRGPGRCS